MVPIHPLRCNWVGYLLYTNVALRLLLFVVQIKRQSQVISLLLRFN